MNASASALLRRIVRILSVAGASVAVLVLAFGWWIRQPNRGDLPYPGSFHADPAALAEHVRFLAVTDPPRNWQSAGGMVRAADYIAARFAGTGARCSEQSYPARTIEAKNILARFGPESGPLVVVGAHYDVFGRLPGADDNASGVAGLLELARLLGQARLDAPVELVAFSTEEPPFFGGAEMGSAVHAASLERTSARVRAMIALEMIGFYSEPPPGGSFLLRLVYPSNGDFVTLVGRWSDRGLVRLAKKCFRGATRLPAVSYTGPVVIGSDLSDHRSYWAAGFPAIMVSDTAYLRNPNYHTAGDTPATLDYQRMAGVVDGVFSTVVHLANE